MKKSGLTFVKWLINRFVNSKNDKINKFLQKIQKHVKLYSRFLLFSLYGLESRKTQLKQWVTESSAKNIFKVLTKVYKTQFKVLYQLFSNTWQNISIFEIISHIVWHNFFGLKFNGKSGNSIRKTFATFTEKFLYDIKWK